MRKHLAILFACLFVVMIGYGLTLPVLTFYIERLALAEGATAQQTSMHVGILTGVFALMQFLFAPLWGRWSDRVGRRPLFVVGLSGYAVTNVLFGLGTDLVMLYTARILGGILSAAVLPAATAYVADVTSEKQRGKGMAWLGSAISLGLVVGPAMGAGLSRLDWHVTYRFGHFYADDFSTPFFAAALFGLLALFLAMVWLHESIHTPGVELLQRQALHERTLKPKISRLLMQESFGKLLGMSFLGQFALTLFEGTFALHGQRVLSFGAAQMGLVFVICGLVMAAAQASVVGWLIGRLGEKILLSTGFGLTGIGLIFLMTTQSLTLILVYVAIFALGMAALNPSLAALVSNRAGEHAGSALGLQSAVNSLGQAGGPLVGGLLLAWYIHVPYLLTALPLIATAILIGRKGWLKKRMVY
ncbi:MAG: MFS transporter [bacterium]